MKLRVLFLWAASAALARAEVSLPPIFSDHAVLQRSARTEVWGKAAPGEKVKVGFGPITAETAAGADGRWRVTLDLAAAGKEPQDLTVRGANALKIHDVLAGEGWLTSGQSNMQLPLNATDHWEREAAVSANPRLRWFQAESAKVFQPPQDEVAGHWVVAGPETSTTCSALAYYFGKTLVKDLDRPVGLILTAVGGTTIQSWMSEPAWDELTKSSPVPPKPKRPRPISTPGFYFNQLIHPLAGLTFQGVLWYQGEAHFSQGPFYSQAFPALIRDWRKTFGRADQSFYFCQLPNLDKKTPDPNAAGWVAEVREAQDTGLAEPHTGEVVLIDVGGEDLHPTNKEVVGQRLAALVERDSYGVKQVAEGPRFEKAVPQGNEMIVTFTHCDGGLEAHPFPEGTVLNTPGSEVQGFALSGTDGSWHWAKAMIKGHTVVLSSPDVPNPIAVRYAWANNPTCNLYNKAGWPAAPFRSEKGK